MEFTHTITTFERENKCSADPNSDRKNKNLWIEWFRQAKSTRNQGEQDEIPCSLIDSKMNRIRELYNDITPLPYGSPVPSDFSCSIHPIRVYLLGYP